jgi:hypothetical protein
MATLETILSNSAADNVIRAVRSDLGLEENINCKDAFTKQLLFRDRISKHSQGTLFLSNISEKLASGTYGTIIERFVMCGLDASQIQTHDYYSFGKDEAWVGDAYIRGYPFGLVISAKSMKAKERLLVSGLGNLLIPTIGYGWFDDPNEWSVRRLQSYKLRGFSAIYMPPENLQNIPQLSREFLNINSKLFLRNVLDMPSDLDNAIIKSGAQKGSLITRNF